MTQKFNLSEHAPDPEIGGCFRTHLEGLAPEQFVHRVMAGLPQRFTLDSWEVLARWARPGIAAAAIITAGAWGVARVSPAKRPGRLSRCSN